MVYRVVLVRYSCMIGKLYVRCHWILNSPLFLDGVIGTSPIHCQMADKIVTTEEREKTKKAITRRPLTSQESPPKTKKSNPIRTIFARLSLNTTVHTKKQGSDGSCRCLGANGCRSKQYTRYRRFRQDFSNTQALHIYEHKVYAINRENRESRSTWFRVVPSISFSPTRSFARQHAERGHTTVTP